VARQRGDFLLDGGEAPGAWSVGPLVEFGLPGERRGIRLCRRRLLGGHDNTSACRDDSDSQ
jgi:hypothetical protein